MVWYGMVWYGMVWYGKVRYGMVRYGTVRYGMILITYSMIIFVDKRCLKTTEVARAQLIHECGLGSLSRLLQEMTWSKLPDQLRATP
jgi:hypothetical protein